MSQDELVRVGRRLRELRLAAGLTQAELAGRRFSHAYVSVLEAGRREPSRTAVEYFAQRLGVPIEDLWGEKGASWALQMAKDLRVEGLHAESRDLLERTLTNLERDREIDPRVLVVLHRELARIDQQRNPQGAKAHLERALELGGEREALRAERAEVLVMLADLLDAEGSVHEAHTHLRTAAELLLELVGARASGSI